MKSSREIRQDFLDYFQERGHKIVGSSPVVPDDPTLLFTNAGMNQFKDVFLGTGVRDYTRAADTQKCIRAGGKHNDLEEVGRDTYHHTFFEMLGNWSFGDYYKKDSIVWAWDLLTRVWGIDKTKLYATVYRTDDEAFELWKTATDINPDHILRFGEKENFWEMADTGPCGPCTEIHIDLGPGPDDDPSIDGKTLVNAGTERCIEIWNLVFIQNERRADKSLIELPAKHVDTGMGFERITTVLQGKRSNYETDIFAPLIQAISDLTGVRYDPGKNGRRHRAIADHIRALSSAIADGAVIGSTGRDYVLRRICRRAARFLSELGMNEPGLYKLVGAFATQMKDIFPEIKARESYIEDSIRAEEQLFGRTLTRGLKRFGDAASKLGSSQKIDAATAWDLHQTFGFSIDMTSQMAEEKGLGVDVSGFEEFLEKEKHKGRTTATFGRAALDRFGAVSQSSEFLGYDCHSIRDARVIQASDTEIILDRTPFYPEGGGPKGDRGFIASVEDDGFEFQVEDTQRHGDLIVHQGHYLSGGPQDVSGLVEATVDLGTRDAIRRNHTGTHILHWALREVLGERVAQQGSVIKPELFTFDFTWSQAITDDQLAEIERLVNEKILANDLVDTAVMSLEDARARGATALFGEKYGEEVRVLSIGDGYSTELCGGIHCHRSGDVGSLKILRESSVSAGVRRIEAVTGSYAVENAITEHAILSRLARDFKAPASELESRVAELKAQVKDLRKQLEKADAAAVSPKEMLSRAEDLGAFRLLVSSFPGDSAALRKVGDAVKAQEKPTLALLMATNDKGVGVLCAMTKDLVSQGWNANDVLRTATTVLGGGGGGRPDFAEGRGQKADQVNAAGEAVRAFVKGKL